MIELHKTKRFADWLDGLRDIHARGRELVILLAGGDKSTQSSDIKAAQKLAQEQGGHNDH